MPTPTEPDYLRDVHVSKGVGTWRGLYLTLLDEVRPGSVLDVGAGTPDFLARVTAARRVAVDVGDRYAEDFRAAGIDFHLRDVEREGLDDLGPFDVAVCSDVLEHLRDPAGALRHIAAALAPDGALIAHVPNEFTLRHLVRVALGGGEAVAFHAGVPEWADPHLRRFTAGGFERFLHLAFRHLLPLHDLRYGRAARVARALAGRVPYGLAPGPTFVATNDAATLARYAEAKRRVARG